jgi:SP family sugar:H+ symporter-like MFS transporter
MVLLSLYLAFASWIYNFDLGERMAFLVLNTTKACRIWRHYSHHASISKSLRHLCIQAQRGQRNGPNMFSHYPPLISCCCHINLVALGSVIGGVISNYIGRRRTIQVGCVLVTIGARGMLGTTGNYIAYIVCKSIGSVGLGHFTAAAPIYIWAVIWRALLLPASLHQPRKCTQ